MCFLEVTWILEDIKLICEQFVSISFVIFKMHFTCVALALARVAKENEETIIWLEEFPSFLFLIGQHDIG